MLTIFTKLQLLLNRVNDEDEEGRDNEEGQGLTEYALILALIAIVAIAALTLLGNKVTSVLNQVASSI